MLYTSNLKMDTACSSECSVSVCKFIRCHNSEVYGYARNNIGEPLEAVFSIGSVPRLYKESPLASEDSGGMAPPRYPSYPVPGGIAGKPSLRGL
jgi:hypothetical protein